MARYHENTLVIKHLPPELSVKDRVDFLKHLGATDVRCIASEVKKTSLTFAQFKSKERCLAVLKSLHQREVLGSLLSVEFSKSSRSSEGAESGTRSRDDSTDTTSHRKIVEAYLKKLNSWTNSSDFSQPPPPHISYCYPPPSTQVLRNICRVLAKVPKFYTQVLHLMNKMNLPCPFAENFDVQADLVDVDFEEAAAEAVKQEDAESEEESEIETDGENAKNEDMPVALLNRVKRPNKARVRISKISKPKIVVESRSVLRPEEVFESSQVRVSKKIELKVSSDLSAAVEAQKFPEQTEGFGLIEPVTDEVGGAKGETEDDVGVAAGVISEEELEMNRIPAKDFHLLPVFKNYQPGPPTCRLYLKNLAKTVTPGDLEFIFGRYRVKESGDQVNLYDIRLMQEGRMKGQAFITLQSVELAEKAVKETNGYILKGKAMVVQFARSNKPK